MERKIANILFVISVSMMMTFCCSGHTHSYDSLSRQYQDPSINYRLLQGKVHSHSEGSHQHKFLKVFTFSPKKPLGASLLSITHKASKDIYVISPEPNYGGMPTYHYASGLSFFPWKYTDKIPIFLQFSVLRI
jgi:hypothetical protein